MPTAMRTPILTVLERKEGRRLGKGRVEVLQKAAITIYVYKMYFIYGRWFNA